MLYPLIKLNIMKLSLFYKKLEKLEKTIIDNNTKPGFYGDGINLVNNEDFPILHDFSDQLYMRKMELKAGSFVVSAIHNTDHFWFLLKGKIIVNDSGEIVEHIAPCYEKSIKGAKRLIYCVEDCLFINVHKNPTNTQNLDEIEDFLYSLSIKDYKEKNK